MTTVTRFFLKVPVVLFVIVTMVTVGCSSLGQIGKQSPPGTTPPPAAKQKESSPASPDTIATAPIRVLTKDGVFYGLTHYELSGDTLKGTGTSEQSGGIRAFDIRLPLNEVDYIEQDPEWTKGQRWLVAAGFLTMAIMTAAILSNTSNRRDFSFDVGFDYVGPSGGSCPFFYTYDGREYHFESESFAGAVFRASEYAAYDVLEHLRPSNGQYRLLMTNGRPETHYVNEVKILTVDAPADVAVLPDAGGTFHTIAEKLRPLSCRSLKGTDVLESVRQTDHDYWESDLASLDMTRDEDLRDGIVLEFERPRDARAAKLVVSGVNTTLGIFSLERLFAIRGPNLARWHQQLDHDPQLRDRVDRWMHSISRLHVSVWEDDAWVERVALPDVGPIVQKQQVAVLDVSAVRGDRLRVRLESTTDLWRIDEVFVDYSNDFDVTVHEVGPSEVMDDRGGEVADLVVADDDRYLVTLQGGEAEFSFDAVPENPEKARTYVLKSKGFYLTWTERTGVDQPWLMDAVLSDPLVGSRFIMPAWKEMRLEEKRAGSDGGS